MLSTDVIPNYVNKVYLQLEPLDRLGRGADFGEAVVLFLAQHQSSSWLAIRPFHLLLLGNAFFIFNDGGQFHNTVIVVFIRKLRMI